MKKRLFAFVFLLLPFVSKGQCAMCRAQLEGMDDKALAEGVNDGIVYLMAVPYILIAFVAFMIYRGYKKKEK